MSSVQSPTGGGDAGLDLLVRLGVLVAVAQVADRARDEGERAGVADAHPAAVGHADAGLLAGLEHGGGAVDLDGLAGVLERDRAALAAVAAELEREPLEVQLVLEAGAPRSAPSIASSIGPGPQAQVSRSRQSGHERRRGRPGSSMPSVSVCCWWTVSASCALREVARARRGRSSARGSARSSAGRRRASCRAGRGCAASPSPG